MTTETLPATTEPVPASEPATAAPALVLSRECVGVPFAKLVPDPDQVRRTYKDTEIDVLAASIAGGGDDVLTFDFQGVDGAEYRPQARILRWDDDGWPVVSDRNFVPS